MLPRAPIIRQLILLLLVTLVLYTSREYLTQTFRLSIVGGNQTSDAILTTANDSLPKSSHGVLPSDTVRAYIQAIMDPTAVDLPRLECPQPVLARYASLISSTSTTGQIHYFFAIDLRAILSLLPRLLGSVIEAIRFLGPENCALSIVEGNSADGTAEVLEALRSSLDAVGTTYYLRSSQIDPSKGDRIANLAELRNMALQPLLDDTQSRFSVNTTVVFLNDVAICSEDILELVYQRQSLNADMTCAFDWVYVGPDPTFYDIWIARGMNGDTFFEIPPDGNWNSAWNLFWNNPVAKSRLSAHKPFQVFSCWNGATAFTAQPILEKTVAFRAPREGECQQGEPQLFCKDLWIHGYNKIAVIPSINLEYSNDRGKQIKDLKGYTSKWTSEESSLADDMVEWELQPPERVKCIPSYDNQYFQAWNETS